MEYSFCPEELFFFDGKPRALALYGAFAAKLLAAFPEAGRRVQKTQITFTCPKVFACVSMAKVRPAARRPKEYIVVTFGLNRRAESARIDGAVEPYPGRWTHHVTVEREEELDEALLGWVAEAWAFARSK